MTFSPVVMDGLVLAHALGLSVLTNRHLGLMYVESFQGLCEQQQKKKKCGHLRSHKIPLVLKPIFYFLHQFNKCFVVLEIQQ